MLTAGYWKDLSQCHGCDPLIKRFMGPTWGSSGADRTQVGPMLAPWTLLSGYWHASTVASFTKEVHPRLAKRPLIFNGRLANPGVTSLVKEPASTPEPQQSYILWFLKLEQFVILEIAWELWVLGFHSKGVSSTTLSQYLDTIENTTIMWFLQNNAVPKWLM